MCDEVPGELQWEPGPFPSMDVVVIEGGLSLTISPSMRTCRRVCARTCVCMLRYVDSLRGQSLPSSFLRQGLLLLLSVPGWLSREFPESPVSAFHPLWEHQGYRCALMCLSAFTWTLGSALRFSVFSTESFSQPRSTFLSPLSTYVG